MEYPTKMFLITSGLMLCLGFLCAVMEDYLFSEGSITPKTSLRMYRGVVCCVVISALAFAAGLLSEVAVAR